MEFILKRKGPSGLPIPNDLQSFSFQISAILLYVKLATEVKRCICNCLVDNMVPWRCMNHEVKGVFSADANSWLLNRKLKQIEHGICLVGKMKQHLEDGILRKAATKGTTNQKGTRH